MTAPTPIPFDLPSLSHSGERGRAMVRGQILGLTPQVFAQGWGEESLASWSLSDATVGGLGDAHPEAHAWRGLSELLFATGLDAHGAHFQALVQQPSVQACLQSSLTAYAHALTEDNADAEVRPFARMTLGLMLAARLTQAAFDALMEAVHPLPLPVRDRLLPELAAHLSDTWWDLPMNDDKDEARMARAMRRMTRTLFEREGLSEDVVVPLGTLESFDGGDDEGRATVSSALTGICQSLPWLWLAYRQGVDPNKQLDWGTIADGIPVDHWGALMPVWMDQTNESTREAWLASTTHTWGGTNTVLGHALSPVTSDDRLVWWGQTVQEYLPSVSETPTYALQPDTHRGHPPLRRCLDALLDWDASPHHADYFARIEAHDSEQGPAYVCAGVLYLGASDAAWLAAYPERPFAAVISQLEQLPEDYQALTARAKQVALNQALEPAQDSTPRRPRM